MELIHALEQLSLEVKNLTSNETQHQQPAWLIPDSQQQQLFGYTTTNKPSPTTNSLAGIRNPVNFGRNQLQLAEFNNSIETLFTQLSDLDCIEQSHQLSHNQTHLPTSFRRKFANYNYARSHTGSMETSSQEEDSDCSSQRSNCNQQQQQQQQPNEVQYMNPLVKDLLKRDLGAITETVRKISQILAIGNEMEYLYNNLFKMDSNEQKSYLNNTYAADRLQQQEQLQKFTTNDCYNHIDINYTRSLCNSFTNLCASEPYIRDLPTIIRYNECCFKLLNELDKLTKTMNNFQYSSASTAAAFNEPEEYDSDIMDSSSQRMTDISNGEEEEDEEADEVKVSLEDVDDDVAFFLDCDNQSRRVDNNWTENKLYIDQNHPSSNTTNLFDH